LGGRKGKGVKGFWKLGGRVTYIESKEGLLQKTQIREIIIRTGVFSDFFEFFDRTSNVEEGGMLIGFLKKKDAPIASLTDQSRWLEGLTLVVTDQIPSGPAAEKTVGSLHSDLDFQESVFREIEKKEKKIHHLGSWHSHHCNTVQSLSSGDIESYKAMVNSPRHAHRYYLAILLTDLPQMIQSEYKTGSPEFMELLKLLRFYLLITGQSRIYSIDSECLTFKDNVENFSELISHLSRQAYSSYVPKPTDVEVGLSPSSSFSGAKNTGLWIEREGSMRIVREDEQYFDNLLLAFPDIKHETSQLLDGQLERAFKTRGLEVLYRYPKADSEEGVYIEARMVGDGPLGETSPVLARAHSYRIAYARKILGSIIEMALAAVSAET
jgi:hypothetical protein